MTYILFYSYVSVYDGQTFFIIIIILFISPTEYVCIKYKMISMTYLFYIYHVINGSTPKTIFDQRAVMYKIDLFILFKTNKRDDGYTKIIMCGFVFVL